MIIPNAPPGHFPFPITVCISVAQNFARANFRTITTRVRPKGLPGGTTPSGGRITTSPSFDFPEIHTRHRGLPATAARAAPEIGATARTVTTRQP
ncbi:MULTISPECIES: hypothetical protein [Streptomyces]|uniref:hypothetical protein n=1 Tax=Streptomyces TaxID=1883 RepID=UPI00163BBAB8|nr:MULTISPECIES: hypothetical protein [Streptomyces]MBC2875961.1 hypothetical protein [Streptomyces sp. TYQ1024]UBI38329.1 hypothetical protein K7I03_18940 [Streptomyces mobaraensis]UKW30914.1 hypothetical protein MCU78_18895 [Streptomyces sp. TYQ1024]